MEISSSMLSCLVLVAMVTLVTSMSLGNMPDLGDTEVSESFHCIPLAAIKWHIAQIVTNSNK